MSEHKNTRSNKDAHVVFETCCVNTTHDYYPTIPELGLHISADVLSNSVKILSTDIAPTLFVSTKPIFVMHKDDRVLTLNPANAKTWAVDGELLYFRSAYTPGIAQASARVRLVYLDEYLEPSHKVPKILNVLMNQRYYLPTERQPGNVTFLASWFLERFENIEGLAFSEYDNDLARELLLSTIGEPPLMRHGVYGKMISISFHDLLALTVAREIATGFGDPTLTLREHIDPDFIANGECMPMKPGSSEWLVQNMIFRVLREKHIVTDPHSPSHVLAYKLSEFGKCLQKAFV